MSKTYNVVWFDDEHSNLRNLINDAWNQDIILTPFATFEEGAAYLKANLSQVDAVLLDAHFFYSTAQTTYHEYSQILDAFQAANKLLAQLSNQRHLPSFILSGQTDYEDNGTFKGLFGRHYRKSSPTDVSELWQEIKRQADEAPLTHLRHRYSDAFAAFSREHLSEEASKHLLDTLAFIHDPHAVGDGEAYFNRLRKVMEAFCGAAKRRGLLPNECFKDGKPVLAWISRYLSGMVVSKEAGAARTFKMSQYWFPSRLADSFYAILKVTNSASHLASEQQAARDLLAQTKPYLNTPYLLVSLTYQLLDLLIWYRAYATAHSDRAANGATWVYL